MTAIQQLILLSSEIEAQYGCDRFFFGFKEIFHEFFPEVQNSDEFDNLISVFKNIPIARSIKDDDNILQILLYAANKNGIKIPEKIVLNHLLFLCEVDKIVDSEKPYFFLLNQFFAYINLAFTYLSMWDDLYHINDTVFKGMALSTSKAPKQILKSRLREIDNALKLLPQDHILTFIKEVIENFIKSPYEVNTILFSTYLLDFNKYFDLNPEKLKALDGIRKLLNSTSPIEKQHIYNSIKYFISTLFSKKSYWQKVLKIENSLSNEKLADIIDVILQNAFNVESQTSPSDLNKTVQVRTYFFDFPIYESQTMTNCKQHPALEDESFMLELLEKLQGKFPLRSTVLSDSQKV